MYFVRLLAMHRNKRHTKAVRVPKCLEFGKDGDCNKSFSTNTSGARRSLNTVFRSTHSSAGSFLANVDVGLLSVNQAQTAPSCSKSKETWKIVKEFVSDPLLVIDESDSSDTDAAGSTSAKKCNHGRKTLKQICEEFNKTEETSTMYEEDSAQKRRKKKGGLAYQFQQAVNALKSDIRVWQHTVEKRGSAKPHHPNLLVNITHVAKFNSSTLIFGKCAMMLDHPGAHYEKLVVLTSTRNDLLTSTHIGIYKPWFTQTLSSGTVLLYAHFVEVVQSPQSVSEFSKERKNISEIPSSVPHQILKSMGVCIEKDVQRFLPPNQPTDSPTISQACQIAEDIEILVKIHRILVLRSNEMVEGKLTYTLMCSDRENSFCEITNPVMMDSSCVMEKFNLCEGNSYFINHVHLIGTKTVCGTLLSALTSNTRENEYEDVDLPCFSLEARSTCRLHTAVRQNECDIYIQPLLSIYLNHTENTVERRISFLAKLLANVPGGYCVTDFSVSGSDAHSHVFIAKLSDCHMFGISPSATPVIYVRDAAQCDGYVWLDKYSSVLEATPKFHTGNCMSMALKKEVPSDLYFQVLTCNVYLKFLNTNSTLGSLVLVTGFIKGIHDIADNELSEEKINREDFCNVSIDALPCHNVYVKVTRRALALFMTHSGTDNQPQTDSNGIGTQVTGMVCYVENVTEENIQLCHVIWSRC